MIKVAKFGGSSVASADQFKKVKDIVSADEARRFVVVSAVGRRDAQDNKITDLLYLVNAHRRYHVDPSQLFAQIRERYLTIVQELGLTWDFTAAFDDFVANHADYSDDYIVSRGEWFTAQLMAEFLGLPFVDAAEVIYFKHDGSIDLEKTGEQARAVAAEFGRFVMPGFYGSTPTGAIRLLDRGGGDITGSILAQCLGVDLYENWTDVSGFLSADPRIVKNPHSIARITFDEMRELSYMGANVLHEEAIFPAREAGIPIAIKNTNRPDDPGTIISEKGSVEPNEPLITGLAGKRNFMSIHIKKNHMSNEVGCMRRALSVFERYNLSIEHVPTGIDSFAVVVSADDVADKLFALVNDIQQEVMPDEVVVLDDLALISVVGRNMSRRPGTSGALFGVLGKEKINVRMISQSAQEINIILGVSTDDFERTISVIYEKFVACETVA